MKLNIGLFFLCYVIFLSGCQNPIQDKNKSTSVSIKAKPFVPNPKDSNASEALKSSVISPSKTNIIELAANKELGFKKINSEREFDAESGMFKVKIKNGSTSQFGFRDLPEKLIDSLMSVNNIDKRCRVKWEFAKVEKEENSAQIHEFYNAYSVEFLD